MLNQKTKIILFLSSLFFVGLISFGYFVNWSHDDSLVLGDLAKKEEYHQAIPAEKEFYEIAYSFLQKKEVNKQGQKTIAGTVPHHLLAADMIANFYKNISDKNFDTIILIGPNHFLAGEAKIISSAFNWETPYGILECDTDLLKKFKKTENNLAIEEKIFNNEHAINSQVAFIKKTFPDAKFIPLVIHPSINSEEATNLAQKIYKATPEKKVLLIASLDFAHYMDSASAIKHDQNSIKAITEQTWDQIYKLEVDSPASLFTTMKYAELKNSNFQLLDNSNSAILSNKNNITEVTSYITAYFTQNITQNTLPNNNSEEIKMLFWGDLMLDRYVKNKIDIKGFDYIFEKIEPKFFTNYDLISANLEGTVTDDGQHYDPVKEYDFAFKPEVVQNLKKYNFNFFNIANNHIDDQGLIGIKQTRDNLDKMDFDYAGCPNTVISDCSSKIIEIKNTKIGMIGLSSLWHELNQEKINKMFTDLKKQTDLIIVNIHWGEEYATTSNPLQQKLGHMLIDSGADLIIGHHPHVIQEIETYKNKYIFYSLGNFIFDQYFSKETQDGIAVQINIIDKKISYDLLPFHSHNSQIKLLSRTEKENKLSDFLRK